MACTKAVVPQLAYFRGKITKLPAVHSLRLLQRLFFFYLLMGPCLYFDPTKGTQLSLQLKMGLVNEGLSGCTTMSYLRLFSLKSDQL